MKFEDAVTKFNQFADAGIETISGVQLRKGSKIVALDFNVELVGGVPALVASTPKTPRKAKEEKPANAPAKRQR